MYARNGLYLSRQSERNVLIYNNFRFQENKKIAAIQYLNYLDIRVFFVIIKYIGLKWSPALFSPASPMYLSSYLLVFLEAKVVVD
jgi:hypothetical protein